MQYGLLSEAGTPEFELMEDDSEDQVSPEQLQALGEILAFYMLICQSIYPVLQYFCCAGTDS